MTGIQRISTPYSYSSAVAAGDQVYLALHRGSGDTFAAQFESTMQWIKDDLAHFGLPLERLVKVTVWLKNVADLPEMEKLFLDHFAEGCFPARMTATTQFIDADCLLMIEGIAYRGE